MADVTLAPTAAAPGGATSAPTAMDVLDNYICRNNGRVLLHFRKGATAATITIVTPGTVNGLAIADQTIAVPANGNVWAGPFPPAVFNDPAGDMDISTDEDTVANR